MKTGKSLNEDALRANESGKLIVMSWSVELAPMAHEDNALH
jgi:hypothetical protein